MNTVAVGNYNDHEHALHLTGRIGNKPSQQFHIAIDAPKETAAILAPLVASGVRWNTVELVRALEALADATAPFIAGAIGSRNPKVCAAIDAANIALKGWQPCLSG